LKRTNLTLLWVTVILIVLSIVVPAAISFLIVHVGLLILKYLSTFIHEMGHFIAGKISGFNIKEVIIGERSKLFSVKIRGTPITFKFGSGGVNVAQLKLTVQDKIKIRFVLFILGGVSLQLLTLLNVYFFLGIGDQRNLYMPLWFSLILIRDVVRDLFPRNYYYDNESYPSDGLRLIQILRLQKEG